jgi:pyridoxamine 5'-phosphate oxidase
MLRTDIADLRKEYTRAILNPEDLPDHPMQAFSNWFDFALHEQVHEPNAMVLSTVSRNRPSSRVVLLKGMADNGFVFYTNYNSKKGKELLENPFACLNFHWWQQERQIRIEGKVERISAEESDQYFQSRPRLSQAGAIVSAQSTIISSREPLDESMSVLMDDEAGVPLQRPSNWGGYCLLPDYLEFWQGRPGRVHDRIAYALDASGTWSKFRLSP